MIFKKLHQTALGALLLTTLVGQADAAIALDRTRVIFNGDAKSVSLNVSNENKQLPYLAQGWIDNEKGEKITSPLIVLPPVQRIEAGEKSQVKIQALPAIAQLPQDRETLFYFNMREIPPRSDKPNSLQIALQTRIKLFYRPAAIAQQEESGMRWQESITLSQQGGNYILNNPSPYYVTIVDASSRKDGKGIADFLPIMVAPKSSTPLGVSVSALGNAPALTYINDYGGRPVLTFQCSKGQCQAKLEKSNS